jgi:hypothetical protein
MFGSITSQCMLRASNPTNTFLTVDYWNSAKKRAGEKNLVLELIAQYIQFLQHRRFRGTVNYTINRVWLKYSNEPYDIVIRQYDA